MDLKEFYQESKNIVCRVTGTDGKRLFCCNKEECVDARYILVAVMSKYLTDDEISRTTGISRSCANKIRNGFKGKMQKFSFRCMYHSVLKDVDALVCPVTDLPRT